MILLRGGDGLYGAMGADRCAFHSDYGSGRCLGVVFAGPVSSVSTPGSATYTRAFLARQVYTVNFLAVNEHRDHGFWAYFWVDVSCIDHCDDYHYGFHVSHAICRNPICCDFGCHSFVCRNTIGCTSVHSCVAYYCDRFVVYTNRVLASVYFIGICLTGVYSASIWLDCLCFIATDSLAGIFHNCTHNRSYIYGVYPSKVCIPSTTLSAAPASNQTSCNTATDRQCWTSGFDIDTDYEASTPVTGVTRTYTLVLSEVDNYVSGDGQVKTKAMLVNGSFPGPTVTANQYANGVVGPIVIHGPASANYDIDLGPLMISDWYYGAADQILERVSSLNNSYIPGLPGAAPTSDNVLFNGLNVNVNGTGGEYESLTLTPGKKHLLRLINPSVENTFTVSLVGHSFTIVATDFVPIEPVNVTSVYMAVGQRYDVVIEANQATRSYWFNATLPSGPCGQSYNSYPAAILSYAGANSTTPTSTGSAPPDPSCADSLALYTPVVSRSATVSDFSPDTDDTLTTNIAYESNGVARVFWPVNGSPINVSWNDPTLAYVRDNRTSQLPTDENVISVPKANVGHDVIILGASTPLADPLSGNHTLRSYNPSTDAAKLNGNNPTRRDTTMLPAWGWLVVAFKTNNPGSWLFHCHLAWHVSQGFAVQFLEQLNAIPQSVDLSGLADQCQNWNNYYPAEDPFLKTDSGL
ncbi:laccase [Grosmannia clavigera kw1407]|uniref:laccase n=1 Tax=Grosmannia clavigera (strain kw1407 / UAMH 11150) TaxID=655863 RepID=F0XG23_GROCL|nr:laccase [Grosmannia clavigera kw1407]EFX03359.1 laccase [Grosmannia clavigera kw1407]